MADLISAREMSVLSETLLLVLKQVGGLVVADLVPFHSQRASCSSALARISSTLLRIGLLWLGFLPIRILVLWYNLLG